jgi:hypothetical protein
VTVPIVAASTATGNLTNMASVFDMKNNTAGDNKTTKICTDCVVPTVSSGRYLCELADPEIADVRPGSSCQRCTFNTSLACMHANINAVVTAAVTKVAAEAPVIVAKPDGVSMLGTLPGYSLVVCWYCWGALAQLGCYWNQHTLAG